MSAALHAERISTGYQPRPLQAVLHRRLKRFSVIVCHRRFGKTVFAVNEMLDQALRNERQNPQYAYLAPFRDQAKRVAWEYMKQYTANIPGVTVNEAELRIDIPRPAKNDRIRLMILGADNPAALKGIYLDGAVLDEYGEMLPSAWREAIRPTLSDRMGWAIFIGTPKGRNNFWELYSYALTEGDPEWFCALFKASESGVLPQSEIDSMRRTMTEEEAEQELECSFQAALVGAYFSKEMAAAEREKRITTVPYDPALPVTTWWDLGINDTCAIWFVQSHGREHRMVDYIQQADTRIPAFVEMIRTKARENNCATGAFGLPHDVKVRELSSGKSRIETFQNLGIRGPNLIVVPRIEDKLDSIHAARMILPRCVFDAVRCKKGLEALMNYQRKWDSKQNVFSPQPMHNWASNGADAFQQFAMGVTDRPFGEAAVRRPTKAKGNWNIFA